MPNIPQEQFQGAEQGTEISKKVRNSRLRLILLLLTAIGSGSMALYIKNQENGNFDFDKRMEELRKREKFHMQKMQEPKLITPDPTYNPEKEPNAPIDTKKNEQKKIQNHSEEDDCRESMIA